MSTLTRSIAVFGGNGLLGKRICEEGVRNGYIVHAFSRSGRMPKPVNHHDVAWMSKVQWHEANILDPKTYQKSIAHVDTVVHSIGILFENQSYKKSLNSNFNFLNDLQYLASAIKGGNPMEKNYQNSYEAIQRDSAVMLADAFLKAKSEQKKAANFVYISADRLFPPIPQRYITTKREAEFELSMKPRLRTILPRPGFMYDEMEEMTKRSSLGFVLSAGYSIKEKMFGDKIGPLNSIVRPPISTQKVAQKIFEKLNDENYSGVIPLEELAN